MRIVCIKRGKKNEPKTKAGARWIDLPADLILELKTHRLRTPGDFVFPIDDRNWRSRVPETQPQASLL